MRGLILCGFLSLVLLSHGSAMRHADAAEGAAGQRPPAAAGAATKGADQTGGETAKADDGDDAADEVSPEEQMRRRFPQPVKAGELIGRPVLDDGRATVGHVAHVVRTS